MRLHIDGLDTRSGPKRSAVLTPAEAHRVERDGERLGELQRLPGTRFRDQSVGPVEEAKRLNVRGSRPAQLNTEKGGDSGLGIDPWLVDVVPARVTGAVAPAIAIELSSIGIPYLPHMSTTSLENSSNSNGDRVLV